MQVEVQWAKVSYKSKIKRIDKPSATFSTFVTQVQDHFKLLKELEYAHNLSEEAVARAHASPEEQQNKRQFVLRWHSKSTTDLSYLD